MRGSADRGRAWGGELMPLLVGQRVRLREFRRADVPHIQKWVNDQDVVRFLGFWSRPQSLEETERFVESRLRMNPAEGVDLAICLKDDPEETYIGSCGLQEIDSRNRFAMLGIVIGHKDLHGQGLGRDAVRTMLDYGFSFLGLNKINLTHAVFNERGHRCYLACGLREEGRIRQRVFHDGRFWDDVLMGITREEFLAGAGRPATGGPEQETAHAAAGPETGATATGRKVVAYIHRAGPAGPEVLVFEHAGHPEAGVQVPAGHVEPGETDEGAVRREIREEAGLEVGPVLEVGRRRYRFAGWGETSATLLGEAGSSPEAANARPLREGPRVIYPEPGASDVFTEDWIFFAVSAPPGLPDTWVHAVDGDGIDQGLRFAFRWLPAAQSGILLPPEGALAGSALGHPLPRPG